MCPPSSFPFDTTVAHRAPVDNYAAPTLPPPPADPGLVLAACGGVAGKP